MPRQRKRPGTAADPRNGAQWTINATGESFPAPEGLEPIAYELWDEFWSHPVSSLVASVDRELLIRWITAVSRYHRMNREADESPWVRGSTGQQIVNPLYAAASRIFNEIRQMESQLGIGVRNRSKLGVQTIASDGSSPVRQSGPPYLSLASVNSEFDDDEDDEDDPRRSA